MTLLTDAPRSRPTRLVTRALPVAAAAALVAACGGPAGSPTATATSFVETFATDNGMLYPPELWGALEPSMTAAVSRRVALTAIGDDVVWTASADQAYRAIAAETSEPDAAFELLSAGLVTTGGPWSAADVERWRDDARITRDVDHLWKVHRVASAATADPVDLTVDDALLELLAAEASGDDAVPAQLAAELLADLAPERVGETSDASTRNLRHARDAAHVLLTVATTTKTSPADADPLVLEMALAALAADDVVYADMVLSYAAAGDADEAARVAGLFDRRRVLPDGSVLEPPVFEGTMGSTFRMVRYLADADRVTTSIAPEQRDELVRLALSVVGIDNSHRLAGLATATLLDPDSVSQAERTAAIDEVLAIEVGSGEPLGIDQALAWSAVSEHAIAMGVPVEFPGLSEAAVDAVLAEQPADVAFAVSKLLLTVPSEQLADVEQVDHIGSLVAVVEEALQSSTVAEVDSLTLFGGSLAVWHATGGWPVEPDVLRDQLQQRRGDCRGGFSDFIRDTTTPQAPCNVESTRFADRIATIIEPETS